MNAIEVVNLTARRDFGGKRIKKTANDFLLFLRKKRCSVRIILSGGRLMKELNRKFRGRTKAADILSFQEPADFPHPESKLKILGEIYLNADSLDSFKMRFLLAHGLLHLLGFRHRKKNERLKMETMEKRLLKQDK